MWLVATILDTASLDFLNHGSLISKKQSVSLLSLALYTSQRQYSHIVKKKIHVGEENHP